MSFVPDVLPGRCNHHFTRKINPSSCVVGVIMNEHTKKFVFSKLALIFIGLPLFFYATGDFPRRTLLKESISIFTILAFSLILGQFWLTRTNRRIVSDYSMSSIITTHKVLGYVFMGVLLVHPSLIVIPRFFESGIDPVEAFMTIISTITSPGIALGICSWSLLLILGVTSLLRRQLVLSFKSWRLLHGVLATLFIVLACWHAIDLGRHTTSLLSYYLVIAGMSGVLPLFKTYIAQSPIGQEMSK